MWSDWKEKVNLNAQIPQRLLWDVDWNHFDVQKGRALVAERVVERGDINDFYSMFSLYGGVDKVRDIYKNEVYSLSSRAMAFICIAFDLKKEEMKCYIRRRSNTLHALRGLAYFDDINFDTSVNLANSAFSWKKIEKRIREMIKYENRIFETPPC